MRIIAGSWRGRTLLTPPDRTIRPTGERAREALFGILEHGRPPVRGARFLDLFCGTGAVGLEAASRGAAEVLLVDQEAAALALARANLARLGAPPNVSLLAADAARLGPARRAYDLAFLDPPYRSGLADPGAGRPAGGLARARRARRRRARRQGRARAARRLRARAGAPLRRGPVRVPAPTG